MSLLSLSNVSFSYEGQEALRDVNFSVNAGDYLLIVGENGAGKSTLLKGLLGLKKPSGGEIRFGDGLNASELGYLPQQTQIQRSFPASVQEVVESGCLNSLGRRPFYSLAQKQRVKEALEYMKITDIRKQCYRNLSGGQQQRVLLARAICAMKKLLILDEPVTGLDPKAQTELYEFVDALNRERGITVIMVSHDVRDALPHANHVLQLDRRQLFFGTAEEYRKTELAEIFLKEGK